MRIAICDDEKSCREDILMHLKQNNYEIKINSLDEFSSGEELVKSYDNGKKYDVIFLDVEMNEISGLEAAKRIRQTDQDVIFIFFTNHKEYVYDSLKLSIFDYLIKPVNKNILGELFLRIIEKYKRQHYLIEIKSKDGIDTIEVKDIAFIESNNRHIVINKVNNNKIICTGNLSYYEDLLSSYGFISCHKSVLINLGFIKAINQSNITTKDNRIVEMSVRKRRECLSAFNKYLSRIKI